MATSINQSFYKFSVNEDLNSVYTRWTKYINRFETYLIAMGVVDDIQKRALLLHFSGEEIQDIADTLPATGTTYAEIKAALDTYLKPKSNEIFDIWTFQKLAQSEGESIHQYHLRLVEAAKKCNFPDVNKSIQTQLILGTTNEKLRQYCFTHQNIDTSGILSQGKLLEEVLYQTKTIQEMPLKTEREDEIATLRQEINALKLQNNNRTSSSPRIKKLSCFNCGGDYPHVQSCPARNQQCKKCLKMNHFARVMPFPTHS